MLKNGETSTPSSAEHNSTTLGQIWVIKSPISVIESLFFVISSIKLSTLNLLTSALNFC